MAKGPYASDAHLGYQTSSPDDSKALQVLVHPERMADRDDCPHYLRCLAKAAEHRGCAKRSVCYGCHGEPRPESIAVLITEVAAQYKTTARAIRGHAQWKEVCAARRRIWELGNLYGWSDTELARATGVTRQTVGEWLDTPRRRQ